MIDNIKKYYLFIFLQLLLWTPLIYDKTPIIKPKFLEGVDSVFTKPKNNFDAWFQNAFQSEYEEYLNNSNVLRPFFVRIKNQLDYSLFNTTAAPGVVIGKQNNLFIKSYIEDYNGSNFLGEKIIDKKLFRIKFLQNELKKKNIDLVVIFAPGKASFYPEYIPDNYLRFKKDTSNFSYMSQKAKELNINTIDFNSFFKKIKDSCSIKIYPKNGAHWTSYAVGLAADSLIKYIEKLKGIDLPDLSWNKINYSKDAKYSDNDISKLLNLQFNIKEGNLPYPEFVFNKTDKKILKSIVISDSYWWGFIDNNIEANIFPENQFWFYFKDIYKNGSKINSVSNINVKTEIERNDLIILMATEATLFMFPFDFEYKLGEDYLTGLQLTELFIDIIARDKNWCLLIARKAAELNQPVGTVLLNEAYFMAKEKMNGR
ncbi:MAG: hypothetical protein A2275_04000 [Bacteroidetes bacterium RIFOXYA12_FULL_35_11]|nr:MAG: hypothetical protein A2X01_02940 [Bacteroidetes bacterium GWF2_35_48]OFY73453.1 MAG: hypothetical protein A2275_04000 [Bacteroidetes bacterium RIFOXYA12_FULL_35_11]